jgi:type IV pilus assembly protein PilB
MDHVPKLGDILVDAGLLKPEQLKTALNYQQQTGLRLGEIIEKLGFVKEDTILGCLAAQQHKEIVNLHHMVIPSGLVKKIPFHIIEQYNIIPISIQNDVLVIATSDPTDLEAFEQVQLLTDLKVEVVLATSNEIRNAIRDTFQKAEKKLQEKTEILQGLNTNAAIKKRQKQIEDVLTQPLTRLLIEKKIITEEEIVAKIEEK